ncbi:hypothetical protein T492DRAFT_993403, partial [Pavlovales sp. CCMP2436]
MGAIWPPEATGRVDRPAPDRGLATPIGNAKQLPDSSHEYVSPAHPPHTTARTGQAGPSPKATSSAHQPNPRDQSTPRRTSTPDNAEKEVGLVKPGLRVV